MSNTPGDSPPAADPPVEVVPDAGVPDGTVLSTPAGVPDEKVVYDYDEAGAVAGWHKEVV